MIKKVLGFDPSSIFPSLKYVEMGFVVSTASKDLPNEAIPEDVDMPDLFAGRDAFSTNAAFIGTFPLSGVECGIDPLCLMFKGISESVGDATIELEYDAGEGDLTLTIATGEIWFNNDFGSNGIELSLGFGGDGSLSMAAEASIMICIAHCNRPVDEKESLNFIGSLEFTVPDMEASGDLSMVGWYQFPESMNFFNIGNLHVGADLSFQSFPPVPRGFRAAGSICLSRADSESGGCHDYGNKYKGATSTGKCCPTDAKGNLINPNSQGRCSRPCIMGTAVVGINTGAPDENFFYISVSGMSMYNILHVAGADASSIPSFISEMGIQEASMSYSAEGLDCMGSAPDAICEVLRPQGIDIPEGFYVNGKIKFLGVGVQFRMGMDSSFAEMQLSMDPVSIGGVLELRQAQSGPSAKQGPFLKAYLGWTPQTIFGNGDWCDQAFCMYGAGYAEIPLLGMKGGFSLNAQMGTRGVKYSYEMIGVPLFMGLLTADASFSVEGTADNQIIEAAVSIKTGDIFLKIANAVFKILSVIYNVITEGINFVKPLLEVAEEFINTAIGPMKIGLKVASSGIKSSYNVLISPFKALSDAARDIDGCHPRMLLQMPELEEKYHADYLILMDEYDAGTLLPKNHPDYVDPKERSKVMLNNIVMDRSHATNFLQVRNEAEWGSICEACSEWGQKLIEIGREVALTIACQAALLMVNGAYYALSPVRGLYLLVDLMHDNLEALNPASIVIKLLNFLQKQIDSIFGSLKKGMESGKVEEFAESLNNIFSLQELSGSMKLSPDQLVMGVALICKVFGQVIDFKLEFDLSADDIFGTFLKDFLLNKMIPAMMPGLEVFKEAAEKGVKAIENVLDETIGAAEDVINEVQEWTDKVADLI